MPGETPWQTVGPFFSLGLGAGSRGALASPGRAGAIEIAGVVRDGAGEPVPDALLELWQPEGWARAATAPDGSFAFLTVKPARGATGAAEAPHLTVSVFARGLMRRLVTRIYFPDEPEANARDPFLRGLEDPGGLLARPDGDALRFDVVLQGEGETVFVDA